MKESSANYAPVGGDGIISAVKGVPVTTPELVQVIAPSSLPAGYQLTVDLNGRHVVVAVPEGGVKEGQQFNAIVVNNGILDSTGAANPHNIPMGRWRDGLFDCLSLGICHSQCWLTFCCRPIALGQVMTRMKLDWSATPLNGRQAVLSAFKVMVLTFVVYMAIDTTFDVVLFPYFTGEYDEATGEFVIPQNIPTWATSLDMIQQFFSLIYAIFILVILMRTRAHIREKYQIPEENCQGCEDCCCSIFCSACTICQMARHTADYSQQGYSASCCSETGLDPRAPEVV